MRVENLEGLYKLKEEGLKKTMPDGVLAAVGMGTCGLGNGAQEVYDQFSKEFQKNNSEGLIKPVGCFGFCADEPLVNIYVPGKPLLIFSRVDVQDVTGIVEGIYSGEFKKDRVLCKIEKWDHLTTGTIEYGEGYPDIPLWSEVPFFKGQMKIVLRDCGLINPESVEEYVAIGGYFSLFRVLHELEPDEIIDEVTESNLRGRGGAGFPTGKKWDLMKRSEADQKFVICNADEGDPGAYMNRNEMESDPHMLIEGMAIGAYAMGASEGIIYVRAEYPLAVRRLRKAIEQARERGFLGKSIFGSDFNFDLYIVEGAGAFVCGEETALIASIEGKTGRPTPRPPYPAQRGLYGKPTTINNVETWCNVPVIMAKGAKWFAGVGTEKSTGTKVFSLVGKVKNTGLVEMPMGAPLHDIVYGIGEATGTRKNVKAVQTGGPSGGCIPRYLFSTNVDYESLAAIGAIMGSGGIVVMDDDNCMVDVARYFLEFTTSESCGKCVPCRDGLVQLLSIVKSIASGNGTANDLDLLELLCEHIRDCALCGLGQTAPNPVLTTMKYFMEEYSEHINKYCRAGVCQELFRSPCENSCPLDVNIPGYLQLYKEDKIEDAFELLIRDLPLPASLGRICHFHCVTRCRREDIDDPVLQAEMHRLIADTIYRSGKENEIYEILVNEKLPATGKKIAIVGAGPAGLTAAYYLVRLGHDVTIYDQNPKPGGIAYYGIPAYRLPKNVLAKEIAFIEKLGVKFVLGKNITEREFKNLEKQNDKIFLATGAYKSMTSGIPGEELEGVLQGTDFLRDVAEDAQVNIGGHVVVIGGGNVAIDAARTALRLGATVTIVYRREKKDMPAIKYEIESAIKEGVNFEFFAAPRSIMGEGGKVTALIVDLMKGGAWDASGRRRPVPTNRTVEIPCDAIILAIGEGVDRFFVSKLGIKTGKNNCVDIDNKTFRTSKPNIHAGGDLVSGPATVAQAMGHGKYAALQMDFELMSVDIKEKDRFGRLSKKFEYRDELSVEPVGEHACTVKELQVYKREGNFEEVSLGLTPEQAFEECLRCLRCDVKETKSMEASNG